MGISRKCLYEWADRYPEFSDAIAQARDYAQAWWEDQGQAGMWQSPEGARLNPQLWSRSMAARFPDDYRENSKVDLSSSDGSMSPAVDDTTRSARVAQLLALAQKRKEETPPDDFDLA
jgi:hypothetical protein